ncbi:MAG: YlbF family regulator [Ruminococcaceae bacterium]|nr:YlbF family regulator [Oscillospiraceae bacterium]
MELEKLARQLGAAIQEDARYKAFMAARDKNEADEELNEMMQQIQLVHMSYNHEASKGAEADEAKLQEYEKQFNEVYTKVMANENMKNFEIAKADFDQLMKYLTGIISMCAYGEDPETCDPNAHQCSGNCSSCGSDCH